MILWELILGLWNHVLSCLKKQELLFLNLIKRPGGEEVAPGGKVPGTPVRS